RSFTPMGQLVVSGLDWISNHYLQPAASFQDGDYRVTVGGATGRTTLVGPFLQNPSTTQFLSNGFGTHLLVEENGGWKWDWDHRSVEYFSPTANQWKGMKLQSHWTPHVPAGSPLHQPPIDWLT